MAHHDIDIEAFPVRPVTVNAPPRAYAAPLRNENLPRRRQRRIRVAEFPTGNNSDQHPQPTLQSGAGEQHVDCPGKPQKDEESAPVRFYRQLRKELKAEAIHCAFICGGSDATSFWVIPVPIMRPEDEVATWRQIQKYWYRSTALWKRYLPFYGVTAVDEVKFWFKGKQGHRYSVIVQSLGTLYIESMRQELRDQQDDNKRRIEALDDWETVDYCVPCFPDPISGEYEHNNSDCPTHYRASVECPYELEDKLNDRQQRLNTLDLLISCFQNPETAVGQRSLEGLAMDESFVYHYCKLNHGSDYKPRVGGRQYTALRIQEGFLISTKSHIVHLMIFIILLLWGICTTDWKTSFQAAVSIIPAIISWPARGKQRDDGKEQ